MKNQKLFLLALLVLPWLTVPFLGKKTFKKYLPASIFICTFTKALDLFGEKKGWWKFYQGISPLNSMNFMNFGPYFVTSLWMLKMTYGKLPLFIISNTLLHVLFIFQGLKWVKHLKVFSLVNMSKFQYLVMSFFRALVLYAFQYITNVSHSSKKSLFKK